MLHLSICPRLLRTLPLVNTDGGQMVGLASKAAGLDSEALISLFSKLISKRASGKLFFSHRVTCNEVLREWRSLPRM